MADLKKTIDILDTVLKESEEIIDGAQGKAASEVRQLQARSVKLEEHNQAFRAELLTMSSKIFQYEEYYNLVHPMWGAIDSARKLLAMGKPAQAARMLERGQGVWEREVFTFDLDDFPQKVRSAFDRLVGDIDALFVEAFAALEAGTNADTPMRKLLGKTDNLFDVCDDSLDELIDELKAS